jgi:hypothetical protein
MVVDQAADTHKFGAPDGLIRCGAEQAEPAVPLVLGL